MFFAVWPPAEVIGAIVALMNRLELRAPEVRWTSRANLHFTLRFLGEITESGLPKLVEAAAATARAVSPFRFGIAGTGAFPFSGPPRIAWLGAGIGGTELCGLARRLDDELDKAGLGHEDKPFRPHLTIGRMPEGRGGKDVRQLMKSEAAFVSPEWTVKEFALVRSDLDPRGARYKTLGEFLLKG